MNNKKIIIIACVGLIILVAVSYLLSNFFTKRSQNQITPKKTEIVASLKEKVYFPNFVKSQNAVYFLGDQGIKLKKYSLTDQKIDLIFDNEIYFVQNIKVSPNGQKILLLVKNDENYVFKILDIKQKTLTDFQKNAFDANWLNDNQIVFSVTDETKTNLEITSNYGQDNQILSELPFGSPVISISPDFKKAIIYPEAEGFGENPLYLFSFETNKLEKIPSPYSLVGARWSPNSRVVVSPEFNQEGSVTGLVITNIDGFKQQVFTLITDLDKTIWIDNDNLFVAVPAKNQNDKLYLLNSETNEPKPIQNSFTNPYNSSAMDVHNLMVNDKTLYLTSDDILYSLLIP